MPSALIGANRLNAEVETGKEALLVAPPDQRSSDSLRAFAAGTGAVARRDEAAVALWPGR